MGEASNLKSLTRLGSELAQHQHSCPKFQIKLNYQPVHI